MPKKKLQIKTRKKPKTPEIKTGRVGGIRRREQSANKKKLIKKYPMRCGSCKTYWLSPILIRDEGQKEERHCNDMDRPVRSRTRLKKIGCDCYKGDWASIPNQNRRTLRDDDSPPLIKRRPKNPLPTMVIERRINGED